MERSEILEMMATLQLAGMRAVYDEIVPAGIKRKQSVEQIIGALLKAEIAAKRARSINYQMAIAKLPLAKELADLAFAETPINGELVAQLATGTFLEDKRNVVLIGGTGTGKSHIAIGITVCARRMRARRCSPKLFIDSISSCCKFDCLSFSGTTATDASQSF